MRLRIAVVAIGLAVVVSVLNAQTVDPALTAAIAARDQAAIKRDAATVAKYTADDYASINPTGQLMNKKQRVDGLKAPAAPGAQGAQPIRTEAVHVYGPGAAVVRMKSEGSRQLFVWIKNAPGWQAAAIHIVPDAFIPQPPPQSERPKTPQPTPVTAPPGLSVDGAAVFAVFKQLQDANYAGDRAAYEKFTAPEFVRMSNGFVRFSTEATSQINGLRAQPKYSNISVQAWAGIGVVRWLETPAAGSQQWLTRVFAKNATGWKQVATASSAAGSPAVAP